MTSWPLVQPPALDNLLGLFQLKVLSGNVAIKQLKLASLLCTLEQLWRGASEGSQPLGVDKGRIHLFSSSTELLVVTHCYRVDSTRAAYLRSCGLSYRLCRGLGECSRGREATGWVGSRSVLKILSMLGNQCTSKLLEFFSQLRNEL